ncbi:MAG: cyclic pyranopterin monophosphate synthase MoaC [Planctomycetes bacterium]|nr:cyclic pyranopterin monophosphate synthase MoaC [Planctomycetota bacterium]
MSRKLTHFDKRGASRMVDVGAKKATKRVAVAHGAVRMKPETLRLIQDRRVAKGDVLEVARVAGIMAAKQTSALIPMCHPLNLSAVKLDYRIESKDTLEIAAEVHVTAQTGVEMEALTACAVCALTVYDMCKSVDRGMVISDIHLVSKSGGRSGEFRFAEAAGGR